MEITRLRTCTLKSRADFFYNSEWTVEKLWNERPMALLEAYYTREKISFNRELLDMMKEMFPSFIEIEKPGKLLNWRELVIIKLNGEQPKNIWIDMTYEELLKKMRGFSLNGKKPPIELINCFNIAKSQRQRILDNSNLTISKKELQAKNHGR